MNSFLTILQYIIYETACADGVVRVFKLDDASSKSFKYVNFKSLLIDISISLMSIRFHVHKFVIFNSFAGSWELIYLLEVIQLQLHLLVIHPLLLCHLTCSLVAHCTCMEKRNPILLKISHKQSFLSRRLSGNIIKFMIKSQ